MSDTPASDSNKLKQQLAELIDKAQVNQAVLQRFQSFELTMLSAKDLVELLDILLEQALDHYELSDCCLLWFDKGHGLRSFVDEEAMQRFEKSLMLATLEFAIAARFTDDFIPQLGFIDGAEAKLYFRRSSDVKSAAFIPLINDGQLVGCYCFASADEQRFTADKAVDFMGHMGHIASMCLENCINREQVRHLSMIDNLTQVKNRRSFDADIAKEISRAQRGKAPLSCLFVDVDHFKQVNDSYGHQAGDETLRMMAAWIKTGLREGDLLARYGGEEFAILLPGTDMELAILVAERIRQYVEHQSIIHEHDEFSVTLSIGVATFVCRGDFKIPREKHIQRLVAAADAGVYQAKDAGRNQVCVAEIPEPD